MSNTYRAYNEHEDIIFDMVREINNKPEYRIKKLESYMRYMNLSDGFPFILEDTPMTFDFSDLHGEQDVIDELKKLKFLEACK